MKIYYSSNHASYHPPFEILDGGERSHSFEIPARVENIVSLLRAENLGGNC